MSKRFEYRKGFLKLQRLGPVKFGEQSRWSVRAPERVGMWAFPYPFFDIFFAYHKYTDLAPKELRGRWPSAASWYTRGWDDDELLEAVEFADVERYGAVESRPFYRDENGELKEAFVSGKWHEAKDNWVESVGKKVLPLREFWYSGELYTHFLPDGEVGNAPMSARDEGVEWSLMHTDKLARLLQKPGSVVYSESVGPDGKPRTYSFAKDHLEVFIPRGKGVIRDRI